MMQILQAGGAFAINMQLVLGFRCLTLTQEALYQTAVGLSMQSLAGVGDYANTSARFVIATKPI